MIDNRSKIFSSTRKFNIKAKYYSYKTLILITSEGKQEVSKVDYTDEDNKYRQNNLKQATKIYIGLLSAEIYKH
ncbi:hypothetical protein D1627_00225 [Pontibacter oryzae]|uniref:Uncharacterized protein n=1 Tax=Pontibacter oryzae TaxID=2304593 RepID=A0A399SK98_9BACT|nr:hypothetical protein D1627_00225 [Pontibacter oryzae]